MADQDSAKRAADLDREAEAHERRARNFRQMAQNVRDGRPVTEGVPRDA